MLKKCQHYLSGPIWGNMHCDESDAPASVDLAVTRASVSPLLSPLLRHCPAPSPTLSTVVFNCCHSAVSHYVALAAATKWLHLFVKWPLQRQLSCSVLLL